MRITVLILAWITPAIIAGTLGWSGIWGAGSALGDYLIPIPVAGGVLHVPSFLVAASIIVFGRHLPIAIIRHLSVFAFALSIAAISLQMDFQRINWWLFTDYQPHGSPFRFGKNPFYLFVATDAFWVGMYALKNSHLRGLRYWLCLPLIPVVIIGVHAIQYRTIGPSFQIIGSVTGKVRGEETNVVYTSASYNKKTFLDWVETKANFARPWMNPNAEHVAIIFTGSMQFKRWRQLDEMIKQNTVATVCLYEEDCSTIAHKGYYDCFEDRKTVEEKLSVLVTGEATGLGKDIDRWFAGVQVCFTENVPEACGPDIALSRLCEGLVRNHRRNIKRFIKIYGENSDQLQFVRSTAGSMGLSEK